MTNVPSPTPPPLEVDDTHFHRDVDSDDMRRVHPDFPVDGTEATRRTYQWWRDLAAYAAICHDFPRLIPPGRSRSLPGDGKLHAGQHTELTRECYDSIDCVVHDVLGVIRQRRRDALRDDGDHSRKSTAATDRLTDPSIE